MQICGAASLLLCHHLSSLPCSHMRWVWDSDSGHYEDVAYCLVFPECDTDVSEECTACVFRVEDMLINHSTCCILFACILHLRPWRWSQYVPPKCQRTSIRLHDVTSQNFRASRNTAFTLSRYFARAVRPAADTLLRLGAINQPTRLVELLTQAGPKYNNTNWAVYLCFSSFVKHTNIYKTLLNKFSCCFQFLLHNDDTKSSPVTAVCLEKLRLARNHSANSLHIYTMNVRPA
jgi:hypothetical protein